MQKKVCSCINLKEETPDLQKKIIIFPQDYAYSHSSSTNHEILCTRVPAIATIILARFAPSDFCEFSHLKNVSVGILSNKEEIAAVQAC